MAILYYITQYDISSHFFSGNADSSKWCLNLFNQSAILHLIFFIFLLQLINLLFLIQNVIFFLIQYKIFLKMKRSKCTSHSWYFCFSELDFSKIKVHFWVCEHEFPKLQVHFCIYIFEKSNFYQWTLNNSVNCQAFLLQKCTLSKWRNGIWLLKDQMYVCISYFFIFLFKLNIIF